MTQNQHSWSTSSSSEQGQSAADRWVNPVLVGTTITLRPVVAEDAAAMWEMVHDPEGNDLTATTADFTYEQVADWAATRNPQPERVDLAIIEHATGEYAGEVVLNDYDEVRNATNFRIALRGPDWYGRGLGTEATRLIVDHGLNTVGLDLITLEVLQRNPRARRAYEKSGFVVTGEKTEDGEVWVTMQTPGPDGRRPTTAAF